MNNIGILFKLILKSLIRSSFTQVRVKRCHQSQQEYIRKCNRFQGNILLLFPHLITISAIPVS